MTREASAKCAAGETANELLHTGRRALGLQVPGVRAPPVVQRFETRETILPERTYPVKLVKQITADEGCTGLNPSPAPPGISQARWSKSMEAGRREDKSVAWYRGHQAGMHDAYLTIKQEHPRIAEKFRKCAGFNKDGSFTL